MRKDLWAIPLTVNGHLQAILKKEFRKVKTAEFFKKRLGIIILGIEGWSNSHISKELGISRPTVIKWRSRWEESYAELCAYASQVSDKNLGNFKLRVKIKDILSDEPRSGAPKRISLAEEQQISALATQKPEDHGIPMTQWTHQMLAHVAMAKGLVNTISSRHVGNILKKTN
jgi:transposase